MGLQCANIGVMGGSRLACPVVTGLGWGLECGKQTGQRLVLLLMPVLTGHHLLVLEIADNVTHPVFVFSLC